MRDYDELVSDLRKMLSTDYCAIASATDFPAIRIVQDAADAIEELVAVVPKWISVEERLPFPREKVLVAYAKGVTIAQMDGYIKDPKNRAHYWRGMNGPKHTFSSVTHWMPLPDQPKEVRE